MRGSIVFSCALGVAICHSAFPQDVVSASSGVLQYFEGAVLLDDKPIEHKAAVFPSLKNGSILRTEKGRAELLLTPATYLRLDENSSVRMVSNSLTDTRLELVEGALILDNLNASSTGAVMLVYQESQVRFSKPGIYRIDSDLGELQVYSGDAEVTHHKTSASLDPSHLYYFALELKIDKLGDGAMDEFYDWARNRSEVIADQNQTASAGQDDGQDPDPGGNSGIFVAPPFSSSPGYTPPSTLSPGYPAYGSAIDPYYLYPRTQYFGYQPLLGIIVLPPIHRKPGGGKWPVSGTSNWSGTTVLGYHPAPGINHWPMPAQGALSHIPASTLRYPTVGSYRPSTSLSRPTITTVPRTTSPVVVAHPAVHVGVGRR